jgi:hypothetical protein
MEPHFTGEGAGGDDMINRLLSLIAQVAQFPGIGTMPSPPIASPVPSLQGQPQEDFDP